MATRYRLCDEDQRQYGGPEWVSLDVEKLGKTRAKELERIETETGVPLGQVVATIRGGGSILGLRVLVWLARRQVGFRTPFGDFDIRTLLVDAEIVPDEDDEPVTEDVIAPLDDSPAGSETPD